MRGRPYPRYSDMIPLPGLRGDLEALAPYAGQSASLIHDEDTAGNIVATITEQASHALANVTGTAEER